MKAKTMQRVIIAFLLLAIASVSSARQDDAAQIAEHLRRLQSPQWRLQQAASSQVFNEALMKGDYSWSGPFVAGTPEGKNYLGFSEEQGTRYTSLTQGGWFMEASQRNNLALMKAYAEMRRLQPKDDPYLENATEEQKQLYFEAAKVPMRLNFEGAGREIDALLSPEQKKKLLTLSLQLGSTNGKTLELLELGDDQKKQIAAVEESMDAEMTELFEEQKDLHLESMRRASEALAAQSKENPPASFEELNERLQKEFTKHHNAEDLQKKRQEIDKRLAVLMNKKRKALMNVLTDEQLDRMQEIIDAMPEFLKKQLYGNAAKDDDQWRPGPQSWKPGDGVPEEFKKERQKGVFPGGSSK